VSEIFGAVYSNAYNLMYGEKDYASECDLIERLFQRYSTNSVSGLLDLGCGTGNHAFVMAKRGYDVVGVERSPHMLALAEQRLSQAPNAKLCFRPGDIRAVELGQQFDAALIMFAVLGYQIEDNEVLSTLTAARRHLKPGALLIFDVWYGPAVVHEKPSERTRVIPTREGSILRVASGELDIPNHICTVRFQLRQLEGDRLVAETQETHRMRYFFAEDLNMFLERSGFKLVRLGAFPEFDQEPSETTWNVLCVARAV
jgi:SAM-dependent methyltransferase